MTYLAFALKWRPKNFDEIIGQNHIAGTLKNAIEKNRLVHAYLFAGPRGVGKTSTARILAKALNCKNGPTVNPCQQCSSCVEISQARSLDVIEIDGASNRGIDEIRALRENVKFSPLNGKFKIYIIDEVHMLTTEAFNALLKTLEEPPQFVKFIFATTQPHKVISTILSRCQRFDFRRIPVMEIIAQLQKIISAENIEVDKEVLFAVAKSSDGSLRDAESVLDQLVSFSKDKVSLKEVISILGVVEQDALFEITDKIIQKDSRAALGLLNNIIDDGKDMGVFLNNLIEHFRNLMIARITNADSKLIDLPEDICVRLLKQSQGFTLEEIFSAFNILINAQEMSKRLESLRIPLEISLIKLAHDKRSSGTARDINPAPKYVPQTKQNPVIEEKSLPNPAKEFHPAPPGQVQNVSLDEAKGAWQNIIDNLAKVKMSMATYLSEGALIGLERNILAISFPRNYSLHKESLERKENKEIIERIISQALNSNIRVNFILSKEAAHKEEVEDHTMVKSALDMFKGRVIKTE